MKLLRIVRSETSKDIIKFIEISDDCPHRDFKAVVQYLFGNSSTIGCNQILTDSSGKKVLYNQLENGKTYFITFEKKETRALMSWENTQTEFVPALNSSKLRVLDESKYFSSKIKEIKLAVNDKATELALRQEDSLMTIKQSLSKIHSQLGSQSLRILDYTAKTNSLLNQVKFLIPELQLYTQELKATNDSMKNVLSYQPPEDLVNAGKRKFIDPRIMNYMKKFSYKDMPMNELTPGEMKRFMKFQMMAENQISSFSSQNTPSSRGLKLRNPLKK